MIKVWTEAFELDAARRNDSATPLGDQLIFSTVVTGEAAPMDITTKGRWKPSVLDPDRRLLRARKFATISQEFI
jgi:hypothetical protein